jgi:hypothetical protein
VHRILSSAPRLQHGWLDDWLHSPPHVCLHCGTPEQREVRSVSELELQSGLQSWLRSRLQGQRRAAKLAAELAAELYLIQLAAQMAG